ncbi:MAG TPA: sulfatase-like hydrolase/transferase [Thermoanaerobaculia bacterium]|jgi:tetratricopeptide (TPR) repeat protein|nr:sulfatase-like hydrolase/transferase [Thermoanaerobaculia bacterium]
MKRALIALLLVCAASCGKRETARDQPPVILISIDTLRADHLPAYGYRGVETPAIDALRDDAILFRHAYSHVPLTLPSHVALLTGQLPYENGVRNNIGFHYDAAQHPAISTRLKGKGYATGAAVSAYVLRGNTGLAAAFDAYDDKIAAVSGVAQGRLARPGGETEQLAEQWIGAHASRPFFYFLHLFEPHAPYDPPEPFRSKYKPYDGEIAAADAILGRFLDSLKRSGIYDRALIILLSDHGEGLGDHGEDEHGIFLYMEDIHVPLLVKLPKGERRGETIDSAVQLIDVAPTIAKLAGIDLKGQSLLEAPNGRRIYSETFYPRIHLGWSELRSLVDARFHYVDAPRAELYALSDPAEKANVLAENRRVAASMRAELEPISRTLPAPAPIDPEEAKKLAALGYLSASTSPSEGPLPDPKDGVADIAVLRQGGDLAAQGKLDEAIAVYRAVLARNPKFTDAWTLLAKTLEQAGRYAEAIEARQRAVQLAPSMAADAALLIAADSLQLGRADEAIAHADLAMKANPNGARLILARAAALKGDFAGADAILRTLPPTTPNIDFARGDLYARREQVPQAIAAFEEEIRRFPDDRQAYANLAVLHLLTGHRDEAQRTMERLVAANPQPSSYEIAVKTFTELGEKGLAEAWRHRHASSLR